MKTRFDREYVGELGPYWKEQAGRLVLHYECPDCGETRNSPFDICPFCGARMVKEVN